jgi:prepilin-type N-terminal cleavage/methylation domain-containing protein
MRSNIQFISTEQRLGKAGLFFGAGFTLIELLVVISVIGFISTAAFTSLNRARMKARDARRMSDLQQLEKAIELYYNDHESYPVNANTASNDDWPSNFKQQIAPYLSKPPVDPLYNRADPPPWRYYGFQVGMLERCYDKVVVWGYLESGPSVEDCGLGDSGGTEYRYFRIIGTVP